jgi:arylsulfatase A-like enzyme/class 3 adenylate cyclase
LASGISAGRTPNIDQLATEGILFTDYYAEASCTAGRANFITGELPIRTGLTTVGQAGSPIGLPDEAPTIATVLKTLGYATGQFGKNHLGDLNKFLPTVHGFDEFYGYLYHLDAMEDPCHRNYPADVKDTIGPRHMVHSYATNVDDATVQPRWGKIGKQKIEDDGELCPKRMETVDDEILANTFKFLDKARADRKPFFLWLNPTRMHVITHLSEKYESLRNAENGWSIQEAGMAQLDDIVGSVMKYLMDNGLDQNTIIAFTTDNGTENFSWPDGGQTPFAGGKGTVMEGGFRAPMILRWPGKVPAGKTENGVVSGLDWFPTLAAAAGYQGDIAEAIESLQFEVPASRPSNIREIARLEHAASLLRNSLKSFSSFVPLDIVRQLIKSGIPLTLGVEPRFLTVFFSDLENFSTHSETLAPDDLLVQISTYLEQVSAAISEEGGTVDKFIGDGVMAFWNAPVQRDDHVLRACAGALRAARRMERVNDTWEAEGRPRIRIRIGLNCATVLVGNVGSSARLSYTALGDGVNVAARLEGINKQFGTSICISDSIYDQVRAEILARPLKRVQVKGRKSEFMIYELLALRASDDPEASVTATSNSTQ